MNSEMLRHPIVIQKYTVTKSSAGVETAAWQTYHTCRAYINGLSGSEYWAAKAQQAENTVVFEVRYCAALKDIKPQEYQVLYDGHVYDIQYVDNFQFLNETLKIKAVRHEN